MIALYLQKAQLDEDGHAQDDSPDRADRGGRGTGRSPDVRSCAAGAPWARAAVLLDRWPAIRNM
jgi:hypothetical protein